MTATSSLDTSGVAAEVARLVNENEEVPGATFAVWDGERLYEAAAGILNLNTGVEATVDSVFQVGSISKVYTASIAMRLVEQGRLDLDQPIVAVLRDFTLTDAEGARQITMRHLLTHTSGIDAGDYFVDFGAGDDACAGYVASLAKLGLVHPPGRYSSYNNAGYAVAGRVIEVVTGKTWHQALRDEILEPAGLRDSVSLPEEALLRRTAVGHRSDGSGKLQVHPTWRLSHALAAAGSSLCSTAADLVRFGLLHVHNGRAEDGEQVLAPQSVAEMQKHQATQTGGAGRGLGWDLGRRAGQRSVSHGGGTLGQSANLLVLPDAGVVLATVTNGPGGHALISGIENWTLRALGFASETTDRATGVANRVRTDVDLEKFAGTYRRTSVDTTITVEDAALMWRSTYSGTLADILEPPPPVRMVPVDHLKLATVDGDGKPNPGYIEFFEPDDGGRPRYVLAGHIARRVGAG